MNDDGGTRVLEDDPAPPRKIRYIFTVVMPEETIPFNPLAQRVHLDRIIAEINDKIKPERIGVTAVIEGDGDAATKIERG